MAVPTSFSESKAYQVVHGLCRGGDVPTWNIKRLSVGCYLIQDYQLVMQVDDQYNVKCVGRQTDDGLKPLAKSDIELLESWSLDRTILEIDPHQTPCRILICELASKFGLFERKLTPDELTRDKFTSIALWIPRIEFVDLFNRIAFKSGKWTRSAFARDKDLNPGLLSQYILCRSFPKKITNTIVDFMAEECGFTDQPSERSSDPSKIMKEIVEKNPTTVMFIDLDNSMSWFMSNLWTIDESHCDVCIVGFSHGKCAPNLLLEQPWFYHVRPKTFAKDAADAALTAFSAVLATKCDPKIPFIFVSNDGFISEASQFIEDLANRRCIRVDTTTHDLISKVNYKLSMPAWRFNKLISAIKDTEGSQLEKQGMFLKQLEDLRIEFPLIPDISSEAESLFPSKETEVSKWKHWKIEQIEPINVNTNLCIATIKTGIRKGQFCGRETPCRFHSTKMSEKLSKLTKHE